MHLKATTNISKNIDVFIYYIYLGDTFLSDINKVVLIHDEIDQFS